MSDKKRILIADSEAWSVALFVNAAKRLGLEPHAARNGVDALEKFKSLTPSLVVVDTLLPKLDGLQVAKKILDMELGRARPLIVTSAIYQAGADTDRLQRTYGFSAFLAKPFTYEDARRILTEHLAEISEGPSSATEDDGEPIRPPEITELHLTEMGVPALLKQLFHAHKSGILTVRQGEITKVLFFDDGYLTHASSNSRRDRLGRILMRNKRVTPEQYDQARRLQVETSGRLQLGAALVQLGALNENDVINAVSSQVLSIVFSLFSWRHGAWSFLETDNIAQRYQRFRFNTASIVFWGLRQLEGEVEFGKFLPEALSVVELSDQAPQLKESLHLTYFEEQTIGLVDGKKRLGEIVSIGKLAQIDVERVLFSLFVIGFLEAVTDEPDETPEAAVSAEAEIGAPREMAPMETAGDLAQTSIARLLGRLFLASASGRLTATHSDQELAVWLERGEIVYARGTAEKNRLANILLTAAKVSQDDYDRAIEIRGRRKNMRIGSIFLELRALTLDELHWALKFQVQQIVTDLLGLSEATWSFEFDDAPSDLISLEATTPNLIMEGVRGVPPPPGIASLLDEPDTLLMKVWSDYKVTRLLQLSASELRLMAYIESGRSIQNVRSAGIMSDEELSSTLHGLLALEVVRAMRGAAGNLPDAPPPERESASESFESFDLDETPMPGPSPLMNVEVTGELRLDDVRRRLTQDEAAAAGGEQLEAENRALKERLQKLEDIMNAQSNLGDVPDDKPDAD